jgi:AcrR family transcriptional regulator
MTMRESKSTRKKQILDAAKICFVRKGYHGTTMDDITQESNLTKGGIYWHFKSKWEIFMAMVKQHKKEMRRLWKKMQEFKAEQDMLIQGGLLFLKEFINNQWIRGVFNEIEAEAVRNKEVREEYFSIYREDMERALDLFKGAYKSGAVRKLDFESLTMIIMLVIKGLCVHFTLNKGELDYERIWKAFGDVMLHGALKK